jgi:hypothetical protein
LEYFVKVFHVIATLRTAESFHCDGGKGEALRLNQNESNLVLGVTMATNVYRVGGERGGFTMQAKQVFT